MFEKTVKAIISKFKFALKEENRRFKKYLKKLVHPLYFLPIKLFTYILYYLVRLTIKLAIISLKLVLQALIYPFRGIKNFFKALFIIGLIIYILASAFVSLDYLRTNYGWYGKFLCSFGINDKLRNSVVRVVGGYSEGSGFFIAEDQVLTNFHVIATEPAPKIIFSDGSFTIAEKILGNKDADLALLFINQKHPDRVLKLAPKILLRENEPLIATGYPWGTSLPGRVTLIKGNFVDFRRTKKTPVGYLQTTITLVEGMSGGPLADQCGEVVGINTQGVAGLSMFIDSESVYDLIPKLTDQDIVKIKVDPSASPEEAVKAFYTYLKARRMEEGFKLLSQEYLQKTNFQEWTSRFTDILDVQVFATKLEDEKRQIVFVKFATKNWVAGEVDFHYYEGTWQTVFEDGVYKMYRSNIKEITNPDFDWFY